ncbi:MAG: phosphatase PAP2 family protein [Phycisphaerales bacterium]|nr:phosphatase PAP2 family protein [Phycisphaerales bacterium]
MSGRLARDAAVERRRYTWRWWRLVMALAIGAIAFFALEMVDVPIGRWCARAVHIEDGSAFEQIVGGFRNFAQVLTLVVVIVLVALFDTRRKRIIIALLVAQAGAKVTYEVAKHTIARDRPYVVTARVDDEAGGAPVDTWRGVRMGNSSRDYQSFPSGHTAAAFVMAGVLVWYYPRAAVMFWVLAVGCGVTRVLQLAHWPSDCAVGAALGYVWAQIGLRAGRGR